MWHNPFPSLFFLMLKLSYYGRWRTFHCGSCYSFDMTRLVFQNYLALGHDKIFQIYLVSFLPWTCSVPFLQETHMSFSIIPPVCAAASPSQQDIQYLPEPWRLTMGTQRAWEVYCLCRRLWGEVCWPQKQVWGQPQWAGRGGWFGYSGSGWDGCKPCCVRCVWFEFLTRTKGKKHPGCLGLCINGQKRRGTDERCQQNLQRFTLPWTLLSWLCLRFSLWARRRSASPLHLLFLPWGKFAGSLVNPGGSPGMTALPRTHCFPKVPGTVRLFPNQWQTGSSFYILLMK